MELKSLDNIPNESLDRLKELYKDDKNFRIIDERGKIDSFGNRKEYFFFATSVVGVEWKFIWVGNNLWQFTYYSPPCRYKKEWEDPLGFINKHLNRKLNE